MWWLPQFCKMIECSTFGSHKTLSPFPWRRLCISSTSIYSVRRSTFFLSGKWGFMMLDGIRMIVQLFSTLSYLNTLTFINKDLAGITKKESTRPYFCPFVLWQQSSLSLLSCPCAYKYSRSLVSKKTRDAQYYEGFPRKRPFTRRPKIVCQEFQCWQNIFRKVEFVIR